MSSCLGASGLVTVMVLGGLTIGCTSPETGGGAAAGAVAEGADWTPPPLPEGASELPDARALIQRTVQFVGSQPELLIEATITYGAVQESGQTLHFDELERLALRRPDQLAWITLNDDGTTDQAWLSDGTFTLLKQPANLWGSVSVPASVPAAVERLVNEYSLDVPFQDLLAADPGERWIGERVTSAEYVGEEWVQGQWTDHVAMRQPGVDYEMWLRHGDEPFPAKMMIVFTDEEGRPSYTARFRRWATSLPEGDATFAFTPPPDAERVDVTPVVRP